MIIISNLLLRMTSTTFFRPTGTKCLYLHMINGFGWTARGLDMGKGIYALGRALQIASLVVMPAAIWASAIRHSEKESILIFLGSIVVFYVGYLLTQVSAKI
jgi:hypothetical protein